MDSPAYSVHSDFSDMDDDELDLYLANCVPLSNLPTPPPAREYALPTASLPTPPADIDLQRHTPELEIYAVHLAHLVPRNVSAQEPAVPVVREFLERAGLSVEVVAFAGCILDALSSSFAARWRDALMPMDETRLNFYLGPDTWTRPINKPELIILSGLALAHDFLEDRYRSNSHWARIEGNGQFSTREVEVTKMRMLQDLDYGLFRITGDMVQRMMRDMHLMNTTTYFFPAVKDSRSSETEEQRPKLALSTGAPGAATWVHGVQTPEPSP